MSPGPDKNPSELKFGEISPDDAKQNKDLPAHPHIEAHGIREATKEHLDEIKREIEASQLPTHPERYNKSSVEIKTDDTAESIMLSAFPPTGKNIEGLIRRLAIKLEVELHSNYGATFEDVKKEATSWHVENGTLTFTNKQQGEEHVVFATPLLPWHLFEQETQEKSREAPAGERQYNLSEYTGGPKLGINAYKVIAKVDFTEFKKIQREKDWYETQKTSAQLLLDIYKAAPQRFSKRTQQHIKNYKQLLEELIKQDTTPEKFYNDFEKKHEEELTAGDGLYNFLLAFERARDTFNNDEELKNSPCKIVLRMGEKSHEQSERYVKIYTTTKLTVSDKPSSTSPTLTTRNEALHINQKQQALVAPLYMAQSTSKVDAVSSLAPRVREQINPQATSTILLESYIKSGPKAVIQGLQAIPESQQQAVLDNLFLQLGEKDPKMALQLMEEILANGKESQMRKILAGFDSNIEIAPDTNQKTFWQAQKLLFEAGHSEQPEKIMREALKLLALVEPETLPPELKEMLVQQKQYLETSMRLNLALDMIDTANMTLEALMKSRKEKDTLIEDSWEKFKKLKRQEIAEELTSGLDQDVEVYMASSHVLEALRLLITYRYPVDVKKGEQIANPIKHYYDMLKSRSITTIEIPDGASTFVHDVLKNEPIKGSGTFDLTTLFVDFHKEFDLYEQYEIGDEKLGEDSFYKTFLLERSMYDESFLGHNAGLIKASSLIFAPLGELQNLSKDTPEGNKNYALWNNELLGSAEKLELEKIQQLIALKHYDEARAMCIHILAERIKQKKQLTDKEIDQKAAQLDKEKGEKIRAQVRLQLKEQGIDNTTFKPELIPAIDAKGNPRPPYKNLMDYVNDRVMMALHDMAFIQLQGEIATQFTEEEKKGFSTYEKNALLDLNLLNGETIASLGLTAENFDYFAGVVEFVTEIIVIECLTMGMGGFIAGAGQASRIGTMGARGFNLAHRTGLAQRSYALGVRLLGNRVGSTRLGSAIRYIAEGEKWHARAAGHLLHGAAIVEMQSIMHGEDPNPFTPEKMSDIAFTAATMYGLGKMQQFFRGSTEGAKILQQGGKLKGIANWRPIRRISEASVKFGKTGDWLAQSGLKGAALRSVLETGAEAYILHEVVLPAEVNAKIIMGWALNKYDWHKNEWKDEITATEQKELWKQIAQTVGVTLSLKSWGTGGGTPIRGRMSGRKLVP